MPKITDIEETPNPNARKFILKEPLTWGIAHSYESAAQAEAAGDALAAALFAAGPVTSVFYVDHWLTVTQDGSAEWNELLRKLAEPLRAAPGADEQSAARAGAAQADLSHLPEADRQRLDRINALLDDQVRPFLQGDGGDLHILGLEGNRLTIHYQGACGGCPSAMSGTLVGIENLVRSIEPELEVIAV